MVTKLKSSNCDKSKKNLSCDKTQNIKLGQLEKNLIVTKLKSPKESFSKNNLTPQQQMRCSIGSVLRFLQCLYYTSYFESFVFIDFVLIFFTLKCFWISKGVQILMSFAQILMQTVPSQHFLSFFVTLWLWLWLTNHNRGKQLLSRDTVHLFVSKLGWCKAQR